MINRDRTLIIFGALAVITVTNVLSKSSNNLRDPFLDLLESIYIRIVCSHGMLIVALALDQRVMVA